MLKQHLSLFAILCVLCLTSAGQAELIAHFPLDETSGTDVGDVSGNGYNGTLSGGNWVAGQIGGALEFTGGESITLPASQMGLTSDEGSVSFWMNTGVPAGINTIFWMGDNTTGTGFGPENEMHVHLESTVANIWEGGELSFYAQGAFIHSDPTKGAPGSPPVDPLLMGDTQWHHVAATWGAGNARLYVDGELISESAFTGAGWTATNIYLGQMAAGNRTYTGLLDDVRIYNHALTEEEVQAAMRGRSLALSVNPQPEDEALDVLRVGTTLAWNAGVYAARHDVYFGTNRSDVNDASRTLPLGVLISQGQTELNFALDDLEFGETYYWRVDEVNAAPDSAIHTGDVWQFTVEAFSNPLAFESITATASSARDTMEPENTVNGSGLNELDQHSTVPEDMWLTETGDVERWIQYAFDRPYKLDQMWVWNQNQPVEPFIGFGAKDVTIEISTDGETWSTLENVPAFAQGTGDESYSANTVVDFGGVAARQVRLTIETIHSQLATIQQAGLGEVRFFVIPTYPRAPQPEDGTFLEDVDVALSWREGRDSERSDLYLGTDRDALPLLGESSDGRFDTGSANLRLGETYFWQVKENEGADLWAGPVWQFTTPDFVTVDDFENYHASESNDPGAIFNVWLDGFNDNANSSLVGYESTPYAEQGIVRGSQSMPFFYGEGEGSIAQATRHFTPAQDWTRAEINTLVLYFFGDLANTPGSLYAEINGTRVDYPSGNATQTPLWKQWNIDLASLGINLSQVSSVTLGIESSGKGVLYVDDLLIYSSPPAIVAPVDPGTDALVAYYNMENTVEDQSGHGYHGTQVDGTSFIEGNTGFGRALAFSGQLENVELPIGPLVATLTDATFATWVDFSNTGGAWQRIFDFGSGTNAYVFLTPRSTTTGPMRAAITTSGGTGESFVEASRTLASGWHHVALVFEADSMTMRLYLDGDVAAEGPTTVLPADLGETTQNWLGRSQFTADGFFAGSLDEFRVYNRALSTGELRYLVGDR